jgi:hypothetical protein
MHRPPLRVHARDLNKQAGLLQTFAKAVSIDFGRAMRGLVNRFSRTYGRGRTYPHHSEREMLRRRVGGFARLHDHNLYYVGGGKRSRICSICDRGMSQVESAKASNLT